mgnify:FL=1
MSSKSNFHIGVGTGIRVRGLCFTSRIRPGERGEGESSPGLRGIGVHGAGIAGASSEVRLGAHGGMSSSTSCVASKDWISGTGAFVTLPSEYDSDVHEDDAHSESVCDTDDMDLLLISSLGDVVFTGRGRLLGVCHGSSSDGAQVLSSDRAFSHAGRSLLVSTGGMSRA